MVKKILQVCGIVFVFTMFVAPGTNFSEQIKSKSPVSEKLKERNRPLRKPGERLQRIEDLSPIQQYQYSMAKELRALWDRAKPPGMGHQHGFVTVCPTINRSGKVEKIRFLKVSDYPPINIAVSKIVFLHQFNPLPLGYKRETYTICLEF